METKTTKERSVLKEITTKIEISVPNSLTDVYKQSLEPDNVLPFGPLKIQIANKNEILQITINGCNRVETLISTVEDLLQAIDTVESVLVIENQISKKKSFNLE